MRLDPELLSVELADVEGGDDKEKVGEDWANAGALLNDEIGLTGSLRFRIASAYF